MCVCVRVCAGVRVSASNEVFRETFGPPAVLHEFGLGVLRYRHLVLSIEEKRKELRCRGSVKESVRMSGGGRKLPLWMCYDACRASGSRAGDDNATPKEKES